MAEDALLDDADRRMRQATEVLSHTFQAMRTGRPTPDLLDNISVQCYNSTMPLKQVAGVTVEEGRNLMVKVWDKEIIEDVDRAIRQSPLSLNPVTAGDSLLVALPSLSEEMRHNLVRQAKAEAEKTRVAVRNVRRDSLSKNKAQEGSKEQLHSFENQVQKLTDRHVARINEMLAGKEEALMQN